MNKEHEIAQCAVCGQNKEVSYCAPCGANICVDCDTDYPARANAALNKHGFVALGILAVGFLSFLILRK